MALLEIRDLHVHYGAVHALQGISLDVAAGQIVTLIGANGAGKSTTLRVISGLVRPTRGTLVFDGRSLAGCPPHEIVRRGVAQAPEGRGIFANFTVAENLEIGAFARADRAAAARDRDRALELFPRLRERLHQSAGTLSGGEQQMVAIGRALMARPRLLCMDEPSMGLSPLYVEQVFDIIQQINRQGTTIFMVEQNASMALSIAHRGYVLQTGVVVLQGSAAELQVNPLIREAYLGEMKVDA